jgi:hypothetical protein
VITILTQRPLLEAALARLAAEGAPTDALWAEQQRLRRAIEAIDRRERALQARCDQGAHTNAHPAHAH